MQRMLDLIEATLDADITPQELADAAGYSLWHFLHLFRSEVGMPLQRYRTRRRLMHALWQMRQGAAVTDAALRWGFDTHSGLYRACMKEYGLSPRTLLRTHHVSRPAPPVLEEERPMLNREQFRKALTHWQLDLPLTPVTWPGSGAVSDSAMYAGDSLVLKACRDDHTCRLALALARQMDRCGLPAALPVPLPDGAEILQMDGMHLTLCQRIPGQCLRADQLLQTPEESGRRIGRALASLHHAIGGLDELSFADDQDPADQLLNWALPLARPELPEGFPADYEDALLRLRELPRCIIHRDPNPGNLIDTGDGIGFVDFDLSVRSARIFDPCYTLTAVLSETFGRPGVDVDAAWPVFARALIDGYDGINPLTPEERKAIPTLMLGNELLCIAAFTGSSKWAALLETNRLMLAWLVTHMPAV